MLRFCVIFFICSTAFASHGPETREYALQTQATAEYNFAEHGFAGAVIFHPLDNGMLLATLALTPAGSSFISKLHDKNIWKPDSLPDASDSVVIGCYRHIQKTIGSAHVCEYKNPDNETFFSVHVDRDFSGKKHPVCAFKHGLSCLLHKVRKSNTNQVGLLIRIQREKFRKI